MSDNSERTRPFDRWPWIAVGAGAAVVLGAAVGWATATVLTPAQVAVESASYTYVTVERGEVGSSIDLNTVAQWPQVAVGTNRASGVVTGVGIAPGDEVNQGSVLYSVNLRPVVVAGGKVPAFRAIGNGAEGADVAQLQSMLAARAGYSGPIDGKVRWSTIAAIMQWQKSVGVPQTGVVELGDVIFVPSLPSRVALDDEVVFRGATLVGGEQALQGLATSPTFTIPITDTQAALIPAGTRVEITSPAGEQWVASAGAQSTDAETSAITVELQGEGDALICSEQCSEVPVVGEALLSSRIVTVPTVEGLVVPSAALVSGADGSLSVVSADGERIPVTVVAAARGMSVVKGVDSGTRVRVPGEGTADAAG